MNPIKSFSVVFLIILLLVPEFVMASNVYKDTIPEVHFAVMRLNYLTYTVKGFYEFSQPYRKSLPEEGYREAGNVFYVQVPAGDFGYTEIISRLTGQQVVWAGTVWAGSGRFQFPHDSLFSDTWETGYLNPDPEALAFIALFDTSSQKADSAWSKVQGTDVIKRLTEYGPYEVVIFNHFYSVGMGNPYTAEWIIIAFSHPPAPSDVGFVKMVWPKTLITRNVPTAPEIIVHNFSDGVAEFDAHLMIFSSAGKIYESIEEIGAVPSDSSRVLFFDLMTPATLDLLTMHFNLLNPDGSEWQDAFPENNVWQQGIEVTKEPVFRAVSSIKHPGPIPVGGLALDLDGDGDIDVFQYGLTPKLWRNDGAGNYEDFTNQVNIQFPRHSGIAEARDFNGDDYIDFLLNSLDLFVGSEEGSFTDFTDEAGLSDVEGFPRALDLENDGDLDLIIQFYEQTTLMENDGAGRFTDVTVVSGVEDYSQTSSIGYGDLNSDGYLDLVLTNWNAPSSVFINNGDGTFYFLDGPWDFVYGRESMIFDFDGDGFQDILFTRRLYDEVSLLFRNLGNLSFEDVSSQVGGFPPAFHADAADFNRDGNWDLILEDLDNFTLLVNEGGTFVDFSRLLVGMDGEMLLGALGTSPKAQFVDLDRDGDLDIYSMMVVFENQGLDPEALKIAAEGQMKLTAFQLYHNYPNPFNPTTTIEFFIPKSAIMTLTVYDLLGREVTRLVDSWQNAGRHKVQWKASNVPSGIYFIRMNAGSFSQVRKLMVVR